MWRTEVGETIFVSSTWKKAQRERSLYSFLKPGCLLCLDCLQAPRGAALRSTGCTAACSPRPMIIKLHNPRDKLRMMAAARKRPNLEHGGRRILIHQDLSPVVRGKRRAFNDVCRALISKGIRFVGHAYREPQWQGTQVRGKGDAEDFLKTLG